MLKIKLILLAFCLVVIGLSQVYLKGVDDGGKLADQQAFDAYTDFAKKMQHELHRKPDNGSVWSAIDK